MADIEYWKQRARDAEAKVKELGGKVGDTTRRAVDMGKAKVGVDSEAPVKDQIKEKAGKAVDTVRRGVDMGKAKVREEAGDMADFFKGVGPGVRRGAEMGAAAAGADLNEPLLPQVPGAGAVERGVDAVGRGVDAARRGVDMGLSAAGADLNEPLAPQIGGAVRQGASDLEALFLDNVMGRRPTPDPYMYQGAPDAPGGASMYETPQLQRPQPGQGIEPPAVPPGTPQSMYEATPPTMMQAGRQMMGQGARQGGQAMEQALRAAEEAFNSVMQRYGGQGGAPAPAAPPAAPPQAPGAKVPYMYPPGS